MIYFTGRGTKLFGGAEVLILNFLREFKKAGIKAGLIGSNEYPIIPILKSENNPFEFIDDNDLKKIELNSDDQLICFQDSSDLYKIISNPPLLLWVIQPYPLIINKFLNWGRPWGVIRNALVRFFYKNMLSRLHSKNSLFFMDTNNSDVVLKYYSLDFVPSYLPIPVPQVENKYVKLGIEERGIINVTYLGRGDEMWKVFPVYKLCDDLLALNLNFNLNIITNNIEFFDQRFCKIEDRKLRINYYLDLKEESLWNFLVEKSDIHFAMGTSALDAAKFGIPTVLLDYSKHEFPENYKYQWLFESRGFCLGTDIETNIWNGNHSLEQIFKSMFNINERINISESCYKYVNENHNLKTIAAKLLSLKPEARLSDFKFPFYLRKRFSIIK